MPTDCSVAHRGAPACRNEQFSEQCSLRCQSFNQITSNPPLSSAYPSFNPLPLSRPTPACGVLLPVPSYLKGGKYLHGNRSHLRQWHWQLILKILHNSYFFSIRGFYQCPIILSQTTSTLPLYLPEKGKNNSRSRYYSC